MQEKISTLQANNKKISQDIKAKNTRIESLNKCFVYADIIKDNKQTFEEWNSKSLFKDSFYNSHKEQIDKYKRARVIIEKITGSSAIKAKGWQRDIQSLEIEITKLNKQAQSIKEEYESINHIKYAVKTVNDDYGIDLSIEIDKAIKRGEKPSVIAQIKKYQEQQESYEKRKERTKDCYSRYLVKILFRRGYNLHRALNGQFALKRMYTCKSRQRRSLFIYLGVILHRA